MEILGLDPKITICKIVVLPIKLYPLVIKPLSIKKIHIHISNLLPNVQQRNSRTIRG